MFVGTSEPIKLVGENPLSEGTQNFRRGSELPTPTGSAGKTEVQVCENVCLMGN